MVGCIGLCEWSQSHSLKQQQPNKMVHQKISFIPFCNQASKRRVRHPTFPLFYCHSVSKNRVSDTAF